MKKEDVDSELIDLLSGAKRDLDEGRDILSSQIMEIINSEWYSGETYSRKIKEKVLKQVMDYFPDLSTETKEQQAKIFSTWRHAAQINNDFTYDWKIHGSHNGLLNPEYIDLGLKFADFLAKKTIEIGDTKSANSFEAVVSGFMNYNWDRLKDRGFDAPLDIPETFRDPSFIDLMCWNASELKPEEIKGFCQARTTREWLENRIRMNRDKKGILTPLTMDTWSKIFEKYPWTDVQQFCIPVDSDESVKRIKEHQVIAKKKAKGKAKGIFVDIDGTLIDRYGDLNKSLYDALCSASKYERVTIFTGGDVTEQKRRLEKMGVDLKKIPVVSKDNYRGYLFNGVIIDDIDPQLQGFILDNKNVYCPADLYYVLNDTLKEMETKKTKSFAKVWERELLRSKMHLVSVRAYGSMKTAQSSHDQIEYRVAKRYENKDERIEQALKLLEKRYPKRSLLQRLIGINRSDRAKAVELAKKYHEDHPKQRTALKFKSSKRAERE